MPVYQVSKERQTKDGRSYFFICYYKDVQGNLQRKTSKLYMKKTDAKNAEKKFIAQNKTVVNIKLDLAAQLYLEEKYKTRKESTGCSYEEDYNRHIKPYLGNLYIDSINVQTINKWKLEIDKNGRKLKYLNGFYNILNGIFKYAVTNLGLESNPVELSGRFEKRQDQVIKDTDKLRYITYNQFNEFISVIQDIMWKTFFYVLYFTGMRKGEIQALTWHDIDFDNNVIIVNKTLTIKTKDEKGYKITTTKNYKNRKVAMNKTLREQLLLYKNEMMKYTDFSEDWFIFGNDRFLPQTTIDRNKTYFFKEAGLEEIEITIHEFRHSHVSLLINQYIDNCSKNHQEIDTAYFFIMVANRIGDTVDTMERVYLHLFPSIQKPIINLLDNL